jgi:ATP/maltotriose-dependent transcriptional regulator MalT
MAPGKKQSRLSAEYENALFRRLDKFRHRLIASLRYFRLADGKGCVPIERIDDAVNDAIVMLFFKFYNSSTPLAELPADRILWQQLLRGARNQLSNISKYYTRIFYDTAYGEQYCRACSNPEAEVELRLVYELIAKELSPLDARILEYAAGGYTSEEIGTALGLTADTVRQHLRRCRMKLQQLVREKKSSDPSSVGGEIASSAPQRALSR